MPTGGLSLAGTERYFAIAPLAKGNAVTKGSMEMPQNEYRRISSIWNLLSLRAEVTQENS